MEKKRSKGLVLMGCFLVVLGICQVSNIPNALAWKSGAGEMAYLYVWGIFLYLLMFLGYLLSGIFLFFYKNWARKLAIGLSIAVLILGSLSLSSLSSLRGSFWSVDMCYRIMFLMISGFPILYLTRPKVKEQFK